VKHLQQTNDEGLQLWKPVMNAEFPLSATDARFVLETLNVNAPELRRESYTREEFLAELVEPNPDLLALGVHKRRVHYVIDDCMVERTTFSTEDATIETIAIESPDPDLVVATIHKLGLSGRENVSVAQGLKLLVGFGPPRYAVIDVGTNSVNLHLAERQTNGRFRTIVDRAEITRLGEGLDDSGQLAEPAIRRTVDAIVAMVDEARAGGAAEIAAVGTAGLRVAPNRDELIDAVHAACGLTVEVISGEDEGRLAYRAATSALPEARGELVVFDSGGGSTQFTFGRDEIVDERFSLDVGAVRLAERYGLAGPVSEEVLAHALEEIAADFARLDGRATPDAVIGMGGTATNLAAVKHGLATYDPDVVQGTVLDLAEIDRQIDLYRTRDADGRRQIAGLQPKRAEVILAGACIVRTVLEQLGRDALTVSDRGLRHGVLLDRFSG
jgi:exopolyphosphatase/guanosine-5'-triphosphate,3'-diphosphate pyrophosphatase